MSYFTEHEARELQKLVGRPVRSHDGKTMTIESWNEREGYWVVDQENPEDRRCISERAIGRTFHLQDAPARKLATGTPLERLIESQEN